MQTVILVIQLLVFSGMSLVLIRRIKQLVKSVEDLTNESRMRREDEDSHRPPEVDLNERLAAMQRMKFSPMRGRKGR